MKTRIARALCAGASALTLTAGFLSLDAVFPMAASAQFGFPQIVFDPTSYATLGHIWGEDISMGAKLIQEYNELVQIYSTNMQAYTMARMMSQSVMHPQRGQWMTSLMMGANDATHNRYGETILWPNVMNGSPSLAPQAWATATIQMPRIPTGINDPLIIQNLTSRLASVEIADGSASKCLQTLAKYRQNDAANAAAVQSLDAARMDDSPGLNTYAALANIANAGSGQSINEMRAQTAINACGVEQQIVTNKIQRDAIADAMNFEAAKQQYAASESSYVGGPSRALAAFRVP